MWCGFHLNPQTRGKTSLGIVLIQEVSWCSKMVRGSAVMLFSTTSLITVLSSSWRFAGLHCRAISRGNATQNNKVKIWKQAHHDLGSSSIVATKFLLEIPWSQRRDNTLQTLENKTEQEVDILPSLFLSWYPLFQLQNMMFHNFVTYPILSWFMSARVWQQFPSWSAQWSFVGWVSAWQWEDPAAC